MSLANVFVSRPTWVPPEFAPGLNNFLNQLETLGFCARTLGSTDYPVECPLDEVIRLLKECRGAIVLGYPQIWIRDGDAKGQPLASPTLLPTEWNHIEAGLAYARGLPLLVIHHQHVQRGIFARGAIRNFMHEVDLAAPAWSLSKEISGALRTWKANVFDAEVSPELAAGSGDVPAKALTDELLGPLKKLSDPRNEKTTAPSLGHILGVSAQKAQYFLDELHSRGLVERIGLAGRPSVYHLNASGRALLVERGLL